MVRKFLLTSFLTMVFVSFFAASTFASTADNLIETAKQQLGVRYQNGGTTPSGFDCSGFVQYVFLQHGISLPRTSQQQFTVGNPVAKSDLRPGDLVFFTTYAKGASHVGIYVGNNQFIHASSSKGISYASINDPYYWGPKYIGAKRVLNDENVTIEEVADEETAIINE